MHTAAGLASAILSRAHESARKPGDATGTTITNPTLLVEVRSPSTEQDDRGNTWQHYQLILSLQEYVLVSQSHGLGETAKARPGPMRN